MKPATLLVAALGSLALFSGWKTREALLAPPLAVGNAARPSAAMRTPGAPIPEPAPPPDSAAAVAAVAARPLFRTDRMAFREDGATGRNYEAELSRLSMIGILTFGGELKGLVVAKGSPGAERWEVGKGDSLPGFKVKEVREEGLSVTADGKTFMIPLYAGAPEAGAGPLRTEVPKAGGSQATAAGSRPAAPAVKTAPGASMTADVPSAPATQPPRVLPTPAAQPMKVLPTPAAQPAPRFPPRQGAR